uniref:Uncharacterized protein n=1 Tax=Mustela putorius furo TaxID=9669 RepID=M3YGJ4_MUSPF
GPEKADGGGPGSPGRAGPSALPAAEKAGLGSFSRSIPRGLPPLRAPGPPPPQAGDKLEQGRASASRPRSLAAAGGAPEQGAVVPGERGRRAAPARRAVGAPADPAPGPGAERAVQQQVDERVGAAVDEGQAGGDAEAPAQRQQQAAGQRQRPQARQVEDGPQGAEGQPGAHERALDGEDDAQRVPPGPAQVRRPAQAARDEAVADQADAQGQRAGEQQQQQAQRLQGVGGLLPALAAPAAGEGLQLPVGQGGQAGQERRGPDAAAGGQRAAPGAQRPRVEQLHHRQVAVHAEPRQQQRACAARAGQREAAELAQALAEGPAAAARRGHGPQRQREHEAQVGGGQVQHEGVHEPPRAAPPDQQPHHEGVAQQAHHEGHQKPLKKLLMHFPSPSPHFDCRNDLETRSLLQTRI